MPLPDLTVLTLQVESIFNFWQLRMIHMMGRENVKLCGRSSKLHTSRVAMSLIFTIVGNLFQLNYSSFAWIKAMQTVISLLNRRRYKMVLCLSPQLTSTRNVLLSVQGCL